MFCATDPELRTSEFETSFAITLVSVSASDSRIPAPELLQMNGSDWAASNPNSSGQMLLAGNQTLNAALANATRTEPEATGTPQAYLIVIPVVDAVALVLIGWYLYRRFKSTRGDRNPCPGNRPRTQVGVQSTENECLNLAHVSSYTDTPVFS